jgi:hypothetical protein
VVIVGFFGQVVVVQDGERVVVIMLVLRQCFGYFVVVVVDGSQVG